MASHDTFEKRGRGPRAADAERAAGKRHKTPPEKTPSWPARAHIRQARWARCTPGSSWVGKSLRTDVIGSNGHGKEIRNQKSKIRKIRNDPSSVCVRSLPPWSARPGAVEERGANLSASAARSTSGNHAEAARSSPSCPTRMQPLCSAAPLPQRLSVPFWTSGSP